MKFLFIFSTSLLITFILTPLIKNISIRLGIVDRPANRKLNFSPVPNIGGLAIYLGFILSVFFFSNMNMMLMGIILGGTFILIIGLIDDLYDLSPVIKFILQIVAALILISFGLRIEFVSNPFGGMIYLGYMAVPLTVLWIVTITNTINLIDGLDGLAAGITIIAGMTMFFVAVQEARYTAAILAIALAGSSSGFLKYNFYPAEIFLGDTGAMFSGYILAAISIIGALKSATAVTIIVPFLVLGIPIFDTIFAVIRRIYNKKPISKADNGHLHHRLLALGWTQRRAVIFVYLVSFLLGVLALLINWINIENALVLLVFIIAVIILGTWKLGLFTVELPPDGRNLKKGI